MTDTGSDMDDGRGGLHYGTAAGRVWDDFLVLCGLFDFADDELEDVRDTLVVLCRGLDKGTAPGVCERLCLVAGDLAFKLEVAFVSDEDAGDGCGAGDVEDLVADDLEGLKRVHRGHRVDENVPVDAQRILRVENRVVVLPGSVGNLQVIPLAVHVKRLFKHSLDRRVVRVGKHIVHKPDRQARLAHSPEPKHSHLSSLDMSLLRCACAC